MSGTQDTGISNPATTVETPNNTQADGQSARASVRDAIKASLTELKQNDKPDPAPAEGIAGNDQHGKDTGTADPNKAARKPAEKPAVDEKLTPDVTSKKPEEGTQAESATTPPADGATTMDAPDSWNKAAREAWKDLPEAVQKQVLKREQDGANGVMLLRKKYEPYDNIVKQYTPAIQNLNMPMERVIGNMFEWYTALNGPNKVPVFTELAKIHGIDLNQIAQASQGAGAGAGQQDEIPAQFKKFFEDTLRAHGLEPKRAAPAAPVAPQADPAQEEAARTAQKQVDDWAADKPYFPKVREQMGFIIDADAALIAQGQLPRFGAVNVDGTINLDGAYKAACRVDPNIHEEIQNLEREQAAAKAREVAAARQAEADKAKKAATGLKTGTPATATPGGGAKGAKQESVRESIQKAMAATAPRGRA